MSELMGQDPGHRWIVDRVPTEEDADSSGFVIVSARYWVLNAPIRFLAHWPCVHLGTPWAPANAVPNELFRPEDLDHNGWIRSRLPEGADIGADGGVLVPAEDHYEDRWACMAATYIVPGQPWAPADSSPGEYQP